MAAGEFLNLRNPIAPKLIRCLYIIALILIAVMVLLGLVRGVRTMMRTPPPRPAIAQSQTPAAAAQPAQPQQGAVPPGRRFGPPNRRFGPGFRRSPGPFLPFGLSRNPMAVGLWIILGTLLRGAIALMVVRILAEMGLAILAMPRRSEI